MFGNPTEIALLVAAAAVLFGAERIPKLARGLGQAKKEFMIGQAEADVAAERTRAEARAKAEAESKPEEPAASAAAGEPARSSAPGPTQPQTPA